MEIGVIGLGVVGLPLYEALKYFHKTDARGYDIDDKKSIDTWSNILDTDINFICVPTDKGQNGRLNMNKVDGTLQRLQNDGYRGIVVIKSTLQLGYISKAVKNYSFPVIVFPEWLRALHAFPDTLAPEMTVIGVESRNMNYISTLLEACCWLKDTEGCVFELEEAVMIKLTANALASTKISFANQIELICNEYAINHNAVMSAIKRDPRCSPRYLTPGKPFGGYCLPKDTSELANSTNNTPLMKAVLKINEIITEKS